MPEADTATETTPTASPATEMIAPADTPARMNASEAARLLRSLRAPKTEDKTSEPSAGEEPAAAAEPSSAPAEDTGTQSTESTGDTTTGEPEAEAPPIEPPRSWKAEEKERFKSLPRETQEYLAERETERDRALSRSQNEAAEKLKGLTAKEQAVEQSRQQYEAALPQLLATLQNSQAGEFADVKTIADVEKLAREDWPRYLQWDLAQKKIAAVQQEMLGAQQRQGDEQRQKFAEFAKREDDRFIERVPDMADAKKAAALQRSAMGVLHELGFEDAELAAAWQGGKELSLRDHRVQLLIRDATLWRDAQTKAKSAVVKSVPPVQRPGVAQHSGAQREAELSDLTKRLQQTGSAKDAAALIAARRRGAR